MNKTQFDIIAEKLIKSPVQRKAVKLVVIDSLSAYEAEKQSYGHTTATVSRDAKRIQAEYDFAHSIINEQ